ncbi:MAG: sigma-54-dependent transcriptional regulator [Terriglobales bacterium]
MPASSHAAAAPAARILAVDDEPEILRLIAAALEAPAAAGQIELHTAASAAAAWEAFTRWRPGIVLLDLHLPDSGGMELLPRLIAADPAVNVILLTGYYSTASAVEAMQKGACDYIEKPFPVQRLQAAITGLLEDARRRRQNGELQQELAARAQSDGMIAAGPAMLEVLAAIRRYAPHFRTLLIEGPTGAGKELVARALHRHSPVARGPWVVANCAAIVESLFESEMFGHTKGAFTGATADRPGLFEAAHQGTLFLDEIGDLPLAMQSKLLRVIQERQVTRVGSVSPRAVEVRIIAATHQDLAALVRARRFREDLYYRLAALRIAVPPLAERREDLPLLTRHFIARYAEEYGKPLRGLSRRAQLALSRYAWPGNVRELEHALAAAALRATAEFLDLDDLPEAVRAPQRAASPAGWVSMAEMEQGYAQRVVAALNGNKAQAAATLGISRATLYRLLRQAKSPERSQPAPPAVAAG